MPDNIIVIPTPAFVAAGDERARERLGRLLDELAEEREAQASARSKMAQRRAAFEDSNRPLSEAISILTEHTIELEERIRGFVVEHYEATGSRRPVPGVEVIDRTYIEYDERDALRWAIAHGLAVKLDERQFESLMRAMGEAARPEFVRVERRPFTRIATDLSRVVP